MTRPIATRMGLALILGAIIFQPTGDSGAASHPPLTTTGGIVAADHRVASEVGAEILAAGGNAVDAAIATALALGVVNPQSSGLGGGGFAVYYDASTGKSHALDFREMAPAALTPESFVVDGELDPMLSRVGGLAVGVPGEPAGLAHLAKKHGSLPWKKLVRPAYDLAHDGFPVSFHLSHAAGVVHERLPNRYTMKRWMAPGGAPVERGRLVRRTALAKTLKAIAERGAAGFYKGWVAADLLGAIKKTGGVMTQADLDQYRVKERVPLQGSFGDYQIISMPLPSSGGLAILEMLGILSAGGFDLNKLGPGSSEAVHIQAEVLKHAFADRARYLGDPADEAAAQEMAQKILEPARLKALAGRINRKRVQKIQSYGNQKLSASIYVAPDDHGTSHLCVVDAAGNAVALTTTVNGFFGANVIGKKSGVVLNNQIDDFSLRAGQENLFGLVQSDANLVGPGKRPLSSMTPTIVLKDGRVVACAGGSGGPRIISGTFQTLINALVFGMDAERAVSAPRIHHQWSPDKLLYEADTPADVFTALRRKGHKLELFQGITAIQLVIIDDEGVRQAASDPRKDGFPAAPPHQVRAPAASVGN